MTSEVETVNTSTKQLCTFRLDDLFFGVEVVNVQEVIRWQQMTKVPLASGVVRGLINLRGQIVTAIDMRARLGLPAQDDDALPMNVVVRTNDGVISLLVDEIGDVVEVGEQDFERVPESMSSNFAQVVPGLYKMDAGLVLLLDVERLASGELGAA